MSECYQTQPFLILIVRFIEPTHIVQLIKLHLLILFLIWNCQKCIVTALGMFVY